MKSYTDSELKPVCKNNIYESEKEGVLYIMLTNDSKYLIAGSVCNVGLLHHFNMEYDADFSMDENLQAFIEIIERDN